MHTYTIVTKKRLVLIFCALVSIHVLQIAYAQVVLETQIPNSNPHFSFIQTYSRYDSAQDNFPLNNFSICIGEQNRTIYLRLIAEDQNSNQEITNGGNVSWKLVSVINGTEVNISSFEDFREPDFESAIGGAQLSYTANITLSTNTSDLFKIITNVTDSNGASTINTSLFTLQRTECIRVEQNATLVTSEPFELVVDYCHLDVVVNENVTGRIIITLHNESPVDSNVDTALNKYMTVDVEGTILQETINLSLLANYTQQEITDKELNESSLQIYKWGSWNLQEGTVNATGNTVNFIVNETALENQSYRLGTYSVRGTSLTQQNSSSGSSQAGSSSGGGSGGGGVVIIPDDDSTESPRTPPQDSSGPGSSNEEQQPPPTPKITPPTQNETYDQEAIKYYGVVPFGKFITEITELGKKVIEPIADNPLHLFCPIIILILLFLYLRERKKNKESEKDDLLLSAKRIRETMRKEIALFESLKKEDSLDAKKINRVLSDIEKLKKKRRRSAPKKRKRFRRR